MAGRNVEGKLTGKTVVMVVTARFEDIELLFPILRLAEEGARCVVVPIGGSAERPVTGMIGHTVPIQVMAEGDRYVVEKLEEISADSVDCLFFPGGYSPDGLRLNQDVLALVKECHAKGKIVAAICHGPWVLISAGLMKGRKATGYAAVRDDCINAGAEWVDAPAVRDGNIVTGRVPDDLPELCREITKALSEG